MQVHLSAITYCLVVICRQRATWQHFRRPVGLVPALEFARLFSLVAIKVARREVLKPGAFATETLHFRCHVQGAIVSPSNIKRGDSHVITGNEISVSGPVVKDETEHSSKVVDHFGCRTVLIIQGQDNFAVRSSLWLVGVLEGGIKFLVVVDLAVGSNNDVSVGRHQGLGTRLRIHDGKTLVGDSMGKRAVRSYISFNNFVSRPVRSAMAKARRALNQLSTQISLRETGGEDGKDTTHDSAISR